MGDSWWILWISNSDESVDSGGISEDHESHHFYKSGDSCLYCDSGDSDEFGDYGEHSKTGDFDESGDSRQHGKSVDSGWFGDFGVYESGESYGLTYKYMILWSRVSSQYVRVDFVGVHVIQTLTASVRISAWTWKSW